MYGDGVFSDARADCLNLGGSAFSFFGGTVGDRAPLQTLTGKPCERSCWDDDDEGMFTEAKERASCLNGRSGSARG